jgi:GntR family transcriptional repressor for pyruvate dehydrogenase complex
MAAEPNRKPTTTKARAGTPGRRASSTAATSLNGRMFQPLVQARAFDEIIAQIRGLIEDGQLQPGDRLPSERELARQLGVSRNTVREALRMLEIAGVVTLKRGATGGSFIASADPSRVAGTLSDALRVTDFSLGDATETFHGLACMAAVAACERMTEEDLATLEANVAEATALTRAGAWEEKAKVHLEFHALLAEATGNPILVLLMRTMLDVAHKVMMQVGPTHDDSVARSRRALLKALKARDADAAVRELDKYFNKVHHMLLSDNAAGGRRVS